MEGFVVLRIDKSRKVAFRHLDAAALSVNHIYPCMDTWICIT